MLCDNCYVRLYKIISLRSAFGQLDDDYYYGAYFMNSLDDGRESGLKSTGDYLALSLGAAGISYLVSSCIT